MDTLIVETQPVVPDALFCDMTAIPATEREEHLLTAQDVFLAAQEVRELPNGYALRLPNDGDMLMQMVRFVENERLCCPFFNFGLDIEANGGPLWLRLTGEGEIKALLLTCLGYFCHPHTVSKQKKRLHQCKNRCGRFLFLILYRTDEK